MHNGFMDDTAFFVCYSSALNAEIDDRKHLRCGQLKYF